MKKALIFTLLSIFLVGCDSSKDGKTQSESEQERSKDIDHMASTQMADSASVETPKADSVETLKAEEELTQSSPDSITNYGFIDFITRRKIKEDLSMYANEDYYPLSWQESNKQLFGASNYQIFWMNEGMEEWNIATLNVYTNNGESKSACAIPWTEEILMGSKFEFNYDTVAMEPLQLGINIMAKYESNETMRDYTLRAIFSVDNELNCSFQILEQSGL